MPAVSVIIPVYGVEKYIERCSMSLFEQTLDDIEFIFVDDSTPDRSIQIMSQVLDRYPSRKKQVKVIRHEKNRGLPIARKTGVNVASGQYICHCDSDDWVEPDMYRMMYMKANSECADCVVCDYNITDGMSILTRKTGCSSTDKQKFLRNILFQRDSWSLCNKMFARTSYYKGLVFPECNMGEDMALTGQLICFGCKKISYVSRPLYNYYANPDSITRTLDTKRVLQSFEHSIANTDILLHAFEGIDSLWQECLYLQYNAKAHLYPIVHRREYRQLFTETYPRLFFRMLPAWRIPLIVKIKYIYAYCYQYPRKIND